MPLKREVRGETSDGLEASLRLGGSPKLGFGILMNIIDGNAVVTQLSVEKLKMSDFCLGTVLCMLASSIGEQSTNSQKKCNIVII